MRVPEEAAKRESAQIIEEYRRGRMEITEKLLPLRGIAERELHQLEKAFADAHKRNPDLCACVYLNESPPPTGPGNLHFRDLANRAAWTLAHGDGGDGWKSWLDVVVAYITASARYIWTAGSRKGQSSPLADESAGSQIEDQAAAALGIASFRRAQVKRAVRHHTHAIKKLAAQELHAHDAARRNELSSPRGLG